MEIKHFNVYNELNGMEHTHTTHTQSCIQAECTKILEMFRTEGAKM